MLILNGLNPRDFAEAMTVFCAILNKPTLEPDGSLSPTQRTTHNISLVALAGISCVSESALEDSHSAASTTFIHGWQNIQNWMRYFCCFATATAPNIIVMHSSNSDSQEIGALHRHILFTLSSLIATIGRHCTGLYRNAILNGGLLDLIVKVWLKTEDGSPPNMPFLLDPSCNACWLSHFKDGLTAIERHELDKSEVKPLMEEARRMILREAAGDAELVAKRLLCMLKYPARANKDRARLLGYPLAICRCLSFNITVRSCTDQTEFMDAFLKSGLVALTTQLLLFVTEDLSQSCRDRVIAERDYENLILMSTFILHRCRHAVHGVHWTAVVLKSGFLHAIARLVRFPQYLPHDWIKDLRFMLGRTLPSYLCHRVIVLAARNAVKAITIDGMIKNFRRSPLKKAWKVFESVVLDRVVLNAIYERDFAEDDTAQCSNVRLFVCHLTTSSKSSNHF